jgi:hypothetical protein
MRQRVVWGKVRSGVGGCHMMRRCMVLATVVAGRERHGRDDEAVDPRAASAIRTGMSQAPRRRWKLETVTNSLRASLLPRVRITHTYYTPSEAVLH